MTEVAGALSERALVVAPVGRDAALAVRMIADAGVAADVCPGLDALVVELARGAGLAVLTEEAIDRAATEALDEWLADQPEWSDFPFILLTRRGGGLERNPAAGRFLKLLGNVTFVERPFHPTTLVSLVEAALRGRRRQYEARYRLDALREGEAQFRNLANSIPTLCWTARPDGFIEWYNQRWYDYTGTTPAAMAGWGWQAVHDPATLPTVMARWTGSIASGEPFEMVFPLRAADGAFHPFLTRVEPVRDSAGTVTGWFGTNTDISRQQAIEAELRRLADTLERRVDERTRERETALAQLHEVQKLESIGQLTGGIAHDFNNLLTPVMANLDLLRRRIAGDAKGERFIDSALQATSRAATLVQRLLAFARRQDLQPRATDVGALLLGLEDLLARSIGPQVMIALDIAPGLPAARIDPNQLELAVLNLAINARDAMPGGGTLRIALTRSDGGFVRLAVTDTGGGMDEATVKRAIEPFYSTKGAGKGTGLGLSMVHGLVVQSGGRMDIASVVGAGTTVTLALPASAEAATVALPAAIPPLTPAGSARILLVDDEELIRDGLCDMLTELGYGVDTAASGAAALRLFREHRFDLVVTDYLMPQMNGAQLAAEIHQTQPDLPVLLITGYSSIDQGLGSDLARLAKPFRRHELASRVAAMVGGDAGPAGPAAA